MKIYPKSFDRNKQTAWVRFLTALATLFLVFTLGSCLSGSRSSGRNNVSEAPLMAERNDTLSEPMAGSSGRPFSKKPKTRRRNRLNLDTPLPTATVVLPAFTQPNDIPTEIDTSISEKETEEANQEPPTPFPTDLHKSTTDSSVAKPKTIYNTRAGNSDSKQFHTLATSVSPMRSEATSPNSPLYIYLKHPKRIALDEKLLLHFLLTPLGTFPVPEGFWLLDSLSRPDSAIYAKIQLLFSESYVNDTTSALFTLCRNDQSEYQFSLSFPRAGEYTISAQLYCYKKDHPNAPILKKWTKENAISIQVNKLGWCESFCATIEEIKKEIYAGIGTLCVTLIALFFKKINRWIAGKKPVESDRRPGA